MNGALLTVLMAAAGTALLAYVGFRLGLSVDRRLKDHEEVVRAVRTHAGVTSDFTVLLSRNQRAAIAYDSNQKGFVAIVLGDKLLVRSLDQAKIMVVSEDRLYVSYPDFGFEPVHIHADPQEILAALVGLGRGNSQ